MGYSAYNISKMVGISKKRTDQILEQEFAARFGNRQQLIQKVAMELDLLKRPLKLKYEADAAVGRPNRGDAESILKIIERECKLFALDQPQSLHIHHTVEELDDSELIQELERYGVTTKALPVATNLVQEIEPVSDAEFEPITSTVESDQSI